MTRTGTEKKEAQHTDLDGVLIEHLSKVQQRTRQPQRIEDRVRLHQEQHSHG
jgi:hypothetical protein